MKPWIAKIKHWARGLKRESVALWFACTRRLRAAQTPSPSSLSTTRPDASAQLARIQVIQQDVMGRSRRQADD